MYVVYYFFLFFFKTNNNKILINNKNPVNGIGGGVLHTHINFFMFVILYNSIYIFTMKGSVTELWFNHLVINNFSISILYSFKIIGFIFYFLLKQVSKKKNIIKSISFLLGVNNLIFLLPYMFCVSTVFTLLFILELLSTILFYKLLSSKVWYSNNNKNNTINNNIPQNYVNMVFFQYWVTFFSTIFIIYFYTNMYGIFGTSNWANIQQYIHVETITNLGLNLILFLFIFSIFLKLGIAPLHLFKVEVYNGLPYITIFFYTTFYFFIFFIFFIFFLLNFLNVFLQQIYLLFFIFVFFGIVYTTILLFDVSFIKTFLAYSTIVNCLGFLIIFISAL